MEEQVQGRVKHLVTLVAGAQMSLIFALMTWKNMEKQVEGRVSDIMTVLAGASSLWSDSPYTGSSGIISPSHVWIPLCILYGASK